MSVELKPCPFCGAKPIIRQWPVSNTLYVECVNRKCKMNPSTALKGWKNINRHIAVWKWDIWPGSFKCVKTMHDIMSHIRNRTKPNDCPILCQLPEGHGRLVDADKLADDMKARKAFIGRMSDPQCLVEDAPTIVPAEAERSET